jgi:hypothetical protein
MGRCNLSDPWHLARYVESGLRLLQPSLSDHDLSLCLAEINNECQKVGRGSW